jgi:trk system potassium uptake protein TrkA
MKITGIPLQYVDLPKSILVAAIHRGNKVLIPNGDTVIQEDDKVTLFCLLSDIAELETLFKSKRNFHR